jgi:uncharacterized SAM-binding protein YcdF (DUF218 family)
MKRIVAAVIVVLVLAIFIRATVTIHRYARLDEARPADAIVIFGAAEYRGRPSPILKARLDHALNLYNRRLATRILTTGGAGGDPVFTEGEVSRDYLIQRGVPSESISVEEEAETTAQSAFAIAEMMRRMNLRSCIVVTDGYHIYRIKRLLAREGFAVYGSPRPSEARSGLRYWYLCARQAAAYLLWLIGIVR